MDEPHIIYNSAHARDAHVREDEPAGKTSTTPAGSFSAPKGGIKSPADGLTSPAGGLTAVYHTLGCKLNFAETASLRDQLLAAGIADAPKGQPADLCIVNTCSVTAEADQKCRQAIRRLGRQNPEARIVVMGCYAQLQPDLLRQIPGVALVLSQEQKAQAFEHITNLLATHTALAAPSPLPPVRAATARAIF